MGTSEWVEVTYWSEGVVVIVVIVVVVVVVVCRESIDCVRRINEEHMISGSQDG